VRAQARTIDSHLIGLLASRNARLVHSNARTSCVAIKIRPVAPSRTREFWPRKPNSQDIALADFGEVLANVESGSMVAVDTRYW